MTIRATLFAFLLVGACTKSQDAAPTKEAPAEAPKAAAADKTPPADSYTVRGKVVAVDGETLQIHHEAIPSFKTVSGETSGMMAMEMPFHAGKDVAKDVQPGAIVEFSFETHWQKKPPLRVTAIKPLPADTKLMLGGHE